MTTGSLENRKVRVVVVGAGLAGLAAAMALVDRGFQAIVCEADDVPGGKCGARWNGAYFEKHDRGRIHPQLQLDGLSSISMRQ